MKDYNPHDPLNMIGEAYERLVEITMRNLHIRDGKKESTQPSSAHPDKFSKASHHIDFNQEFFLLLLTNMLRSAGDKTTLELNQFRKRKRLSNEFHANDLVEANIYYCDYCGTAFKLKFPNVLHKCQSCGYSTFKKTH